MAEHRIGISISSAHTAYLLRTWAEQSGTSVSSLAHQLFDLGLHEMDKAGRVPEAVKAAADAKFFGAN